MMKYTVKYKLKEQLFFRKIRNCTGDYRLDPFTRNNRKEPEPWPVPIRVFELEDKTRIEIPMEGTIFKFSKERHMLIREKVAEEGGK